jgi:hypothetical protein
MFVIASLPESINKTTLRVLMIDLEFGVQREVASVLVDGYPSNAGSLDLCNKCVTVNISPVPTVGSKRYNTLRM